MATTPQPYASGAAAQAPQAVEQQPYTSAPVSQRRSFVNSSVGTKVLMGVTGLLLALYLILHVAGNLIVLFGPSTFNSYSHFLISNPLIIPVEIGLLAIFIIHVYKAITNWIANRRARPVAYYRSYRRMWKHGWAGWPSRKTIASSTMIFSGIVLFIFIGIHLMQFKYGPEYVVQKATSGPAGIRDLYRLEAEVFGNIFNVIFYEFCMIVVGAHLYHGVSSAFGSLGWDHPKYTPWILRGGRALAVLIGGLFFVIPIWVYLFGGRA